MNVFIVGLPNSGRTTVSKSLSKDASFVHIDATAWINSTFREQNSGEHDPQYQEAFDQYLTERLKADPDLYLRNIIDSIQTYGKDKSFIIDGILSPKDFAKLFDFNNDIVVFLNRTDNSVFIKDEHNIAVSVIRDYCYWMSSANLLPKDRWIEYNFKIPGDDTDFCKELGSKNTIILVRSPNKVISHLKEFLDRG